MNQLSKLVRNIAITTLGVTIVVSGLPVGAIDGQPTTAKQSPATKETSAFCSKLPVLASKVSNSVNEQNDKWTAAKNNRMSQIAANDAKWDQALTAGRAKSDKSRQENFSKLEAKATTDSQKAAVKIYEATIQNAVTTRRAAYDAAREAYRTGIKSQISARQAAINSRVATFKASVASAVDTAQASCKTQPTNGPAIRTQFQASLKSARQTFAAGRKADAATKSQQAVLAQQRTASFKAADAAFKTTAQTARDTLKAAFKTKNI